MTGNETKWASFKHKGKDAPLYVGLVCRKAGLISPQMDVAGFLNFGLLLQKKKKKKI